MVQLPGQIVLCDAIDRFSADEFGTSLRHVSMRDIQTLHYSDGKLLAILYYDKHLKYRWFASTTISYCNLADRKGSDKNYRKVRRVATTFT